MLPDIQPGNTKILYFFNCLLDGMHTNLSSGVRLLRSLKNQNSSHILRTAHEVNPHCIVTENDVLP